MTEVKNGVLWVDGYISGEGTIPGNTYYGSAFSSVIIESGGTWNGVHTIASGATVTVYENGVLSGGPILNGGSIVSYNSIASGLTFAWGPAGGSLELKSGAIDRGETPVAGNASIVVDSGATLSNAVLQSGNSLLINGGATLSGATINTGATATFLSGANETAVTLNGGTISAYNSPPFFTWGSSGGTLILESGASDRNENPMAGSATIIVQSGATLSNTTLQSGNTLVVSKGGIASGAVVSNGAGVAVYGTTSNTTVNSGGVIEITSGGTAAANTINGGFGYVDAGGVLGTTTVENSGKVTVSAGASASNVTIETRGTLIVNSGGFVSGTVVSSDGGLAVYGNASNTTVNTSGVVEITSGGTATGNTVNNGGVIYADADSVLGTTTVASGGQVSAASGATISGLLTIEDGGAATIWNNAGGSVDLQGDTNAGLVISGLASGGTLNTVISGFNGASAGNSDSIELAGIKAADVTSVTYPSTDQVELALNNGANITLNIIGVSNYGFSLSDGNDGWLDFEVCFLSGSMIRTTENDVAVEDIQIGDQVVTLDWHSNTEVTRSVIRTGKAHATVRPGLPDDEAGYPVRILKDAIKEGVPYKDMLITAEHCLFFEGKFVPARMLVNGVSIFYDKSITSYDYYHVETERHSVITADGMLTESYLDTNNRSAFYQTAKVVSLRNTVRSWQDDACVPLCVARDFVEPLFRKLEARGNGLTGAFMPREKAELILDPDLHLMTENGAIIRPLRHEGQRYSFMLPANTESVRIVSRTSRPADVIGPFVDDRRVMGVAVSDIVLVTAKQHLPVTSHLQAEQPAGWYAIDDNADCAWTNGDAILPLGVQTDSCISMLSLNIRAAGPYQVNSTEHLSLRVKSA